MVPVATSYLSGIRNSLLHLSKKVRQGRLSGYAGCPSFTHSCIQATSSLGNRQVCYFTNQKERRHCSIPLDAVFNICFPRVSVLAEYQRPGGLRCLVCFGLCVALLAYRALS